MIVDFELQPLCGNDPWAL